MSKIERVKAQLEEKLAEGKFYEAEQLCMTLQARLVARKDFDTAVALCVETIRRLLQHGQINAAAELAKLVVSTRTNQEGKCSAARIGEIVELSKLFPKGAEEAQLSILKAALKWFEQTAAKEQDSTQMVEPLHHQLARVCWNKQDYGAASRHYLRADAAEEHATMVLEWAAKGTPSELDLFLCRTVLQYCCLGDLRSANAFLDSARAKLGPRATAMDTPLMHFIGFLLRTLERDAAPLFLMLRQKYAISLARDATFAHYLDQIGNRFFKLRGASDGMSDILAALGLSVS